MADDDHATVEVGGSATRIEVRVAHCLADQRERLVELAARGDELVPRPCQGCELVPSAPASGESGCVLAQGLGRRALGVRLEEHPGVAEVGALVRDLSKDGPNGARGRSTLVRQNALALLSAALGNALIGPRLHAALGLPPGSLSKLSAKELVNRAYPRKV